MNITFPLRFFSNLSLDLAHIFKFDFCNNGQLFLYFLLLAQQLFKNEAKNDTNYRQSQRTKFKFSKNITPKCLISTYLFFSKQDFCNQATPFGITTNLPQQSGRGRSNLILSFEDKVVRKSEHNVNITVLISICKKVTVKRLPF